MVTMRHGEQPTPEEALALLQKHSEEMDEALRNAGIASKSSPLWQWSGLIRKTMDVYSYLMHDHTRVVTAGMNQVLAEVRESSQQSIQLLEDTRRLGETELQTAKAELEDARMSYHRAKEMSEHRQREITHEILSDLNVSLKRDVKEYIGRWLPIHATEYAKSVVYRAMAIVVASTLSFTLVCTGLCWWALHDKASVGSYCQAHMYQGLNGKEIYCLLPNASPIVREK
ncbi:hypothetical protein [Neokomagataea thailandica]|uniref:Uncharacterized protein n=1 Tax=Neokomagataea tanensis NBRC 106556 TaxID=1223519 RepID=A0ABQ0QL21_9PROT|nr:MULTISPECIES: hypothetical protein [Neokomagataea]GBR48696.1 hypothetical protein AA106556_1863 [Neokomagataea tanensis NBRC 106556]